MVIGSWHGMVFVQIGPTANMGGLVMSEFGFIYH